MAVAVAVPVHVIQAVADDLDGLISS